jgi:hypothetical protein
MAHLANSRLKYDFQGWFLAKAPLHSNQLQEITKVRIVIIYIVVCFQGFWDD